MRFYSLRICCLILALGFFNQSFAQNDTDVSPIVWNDQFQCCSPCESTCDVSCGGWFILAEYLYWQPRSDAWPYAERIETASNEVTTLRIYPDYHSGARIGVGYTPKCGSRWDIDFIWTHLVARDTRSASETTGSVLRPVWLGAAQQFNVSSANANNNLTINFGDVDIGYTFGFGQCFSLHPHVGFRGLWIQNKLNVDYSVLVGGGVAAPVATRNKIDFQGYGVRAGLDAKWNFWGRLSLVERSGFSLLTAKASLEQRSEPISPVATPSRAGTVDTNRIGTPLFDIYVGLSYDWCCAWRWISRINAHIGWEENFLIGVLPFESFLAAELISRPLKGDLNVGGLTTGLVFFF